MAAAVHDATIWLVILTVLSTIAVTAVLPRVLPRAVETFSISIRTTERAARAAGLFGAAARSACKFGVQPYFFELTGDRTPFNATPKAWDIRAFDPDCQPQPLLDRLLDVNVSASRQLTIMVYGDSIERNTVDDLCVLAGAELQSDPEPQRSTRYQSVSWCSTDKFLIMQSWTNGLVLHPSASGSKTQVQSRVGAFNQSSEMFRNLTGKRSPDIMLVSSCAWDIRHWTGNKTFWSEEPERDALPYLGGTRVQQYMVDLTRYLRMLRAGYPDTRLVAVHTMPQRNARALLLHEYYSGRLSADSAMQLPAGHSRQQLWNGYIAALNSALRHVAAEESLTLMDYESIMLQLPTAHAHKEDGFHPLARLLTSVMVNLLLNEYAAMGPKGAALAPE